MAKGFKHGAGGVSALNFKVVGGTSQPVNPKENTIWVNTQTEISGWVFSATEPKSPVEGTVWISTGTSSTVEFNALKKNGIQVYPISAKQYISGAWANVTAKSYQSSGWGDWFPGTYIYKNGDQCKDITGGFTTIPKSGSYWDGAPQVSYNTDHIAFSGLYGASYVSYTSTVNMIDLTNIKTVVIKVASFTGGSYTHGRIAATKTRESQDSIHGTAAALKQFEITDTGEIELDVSGLSGGYYIAFGASFQSNNTGTLKVTEAWIE